MTVLLFTGVITLILCTFAWVFGEVCDLLIYWWQKR